jgi:hypothetical protein
MGADAWWHAVWTALTNHHAVRKICKHVNMLGDIRLCSLVARPSQHPSPYLIVRPSLAMLCELRVPRRATFACLVERSSLAVSWNLRISCLRCCVAFACLCASRRNYNRIALA